MNKKLEIHVSQKNINKGRRNHADTCPIAQAITTQTGHEAHVWPDYISVLTPQGTVRYMTSDRARRFISKFDRQGKKAVKPQNFIFTIKK